MSKAKSIYQTQLDSLLNQLQQNSNLNYKPSLLLHACCGPCSSYVLEYLSTFFNITIFYYNPNIYPQAEYERRLSELKEFYLKFPPAAKISVIEEKYERFLDYQTIMTSDFLSMEQQSMLLKGQF